MESQTNEENESNDNTIKTTISCPYSICDENGQVLPNGNYYFTKTMCDDSTKLFVEEGYSNLNMYVEINPNSDSSKEVWS